MEHLISTLDLGHSQPLDLRATQKSLRVLEEGKERKDYAILSKESEREKREQLEHLQEKDEVSSRD